ncbi:hypothetical protein ABZY44_02690 [Streptomyces sp. NPDC006544]|uniref:hypothetical protein n=1 Tax=Streptomyces sp. NPDC006544 TaxID=3154583 RepID=UPI0033B56A64
MLPDGIRYLHVQADQGMRSSSPEVHVPLRRAGPGTGARGLDLVLLHHSLQFAPARRKQLRARLGPGRPRTARLAGPVAADPSGGPRAQRHHEENRDRFHQHVHAGTLFMTGSAPLFAQRGPEPGPYAATSPRSGHAVSITASGVPCPRR